MEISNNVTKTTSLQRLIMTSLYEMLQRRHFVTTSNVYIACNHMATSERRPLAMSQRRCNDVGVSTRGETTETKMSTKTEVVKNYIYRSMYSHSCCKIQAVPDVILVRFLNLKTGYIGFQRTALYGTAWKTGNCIF